MQQPTPKRGEPRAFCRAVMHEYERQWSMAAGHSVRHPLRLKMERLKVWCECSDAAEDFEKRLMESQKSDDPGEELLADELLGLWRTVRAGGQLPFEKPSPSPLPEVKGH